MKVLVACANFYPEISNALLDSCTRVFEDQNGKYEVHHGHVNGCLELPQLIANKAGYDGYVALGCVIRGETYHYEIVSREASSGLMDLCIQKNMLIVNGILSVENLDQARKRVDRGSSSAKALIRLLNEVRA